MTGLDRAAIRLPYVTDDYIYFPTDVPSLQAFVAKVRAIVVLEQEDPGFVRFAEVLAAEAERLIDGGADV